MSQALPSSLINISTTDLNRAFSEGFDFTSTRVLRAYWKTYAASSHFDDDPVQVRSRNLFWRLLNSPNKAKSLTSFQLAALWQRCQTTQPFEPIRFPDRFNTPAQVLTSESVGWNASRFQVGDQDGVPSGGPAGSGTRATKAETSGASGPGPSYPGELAQPRERNDPVRRTSASGETNGASRPGLRRNPNTLKCADLQGVPTVDPETLQAEGAKTIRVPAAAATFTLPSASSWQSIDEKVEPALAATGATPEARGSLVERDFRKTFAETQRHMPSATDLAALGRGRKTGSIVRFEEAPEVIGRGRGKERASSPAEDSTKPLRWRERSNSDVISDSDEADGMMMTRAESNLSKLIRSERRQSGGPELSSAQGRQTRSSQKSSSTRKEEEILEMGRKAGAPVIPKGRPGSEAPERFRLPSPGATF
ncbi:hypothetical protein DV736_g1524, partial [Chaetothyriales sp. CBS 134916]